MQTDNPNAKPTVDEAYSVAMSTSNLRVGNDPDIRTPGDLIAAAGMVKQGFGMALRRLRHEWDRSAKPRAPTPAQIDALAASYPRMPSGLVHLADDEDGNPITAKPMTVALADADRWMANELKLLMLKLRTLPAVREKLAAWARQREIEDGEHAVGAALLWWLEPRCPVCGGGGRKVAQGTGRQTKEQCRPCEGTGERRIPHGSAGRRLVACIGVALGSARAELAGRFQHHHYTPPEERKQAPE